MLALFDHKGISGNCTLCHANTRPTGLVGTPAFDHAQNGGSGDCASCHLANMGVTWAGGLFGHTPVPTSCTSCHTTETPAGIVAEMSHAHAGLPDCVSCHSRNVGVTFAGGTFDHSTTPATCQDCHGPQRPVGPTGSPVFDHANAGMGDCVSCHTQNIGVNWTGAAFTHNPTPTSCAGCHTANRPTGPTGNPSFDHQNGGMGDCVSCHTQNIGVNWTGASFSHTPTPASCGACHVAQAPAAITNEMLHSHAGLPDCASCHTKNIGVAWTGGTFSHSPSPTTCQDCHGPQRPVGATGSPAFDHANGGTGDCVSCHTKNIGVSWTGGTFSHSPAPASCSNCHTPDRPAGLVGNPPFDHGSGGQGDCVSCHLASLAANPPVSWAGGQFSHTPVPVSCANCHSAKAPAAITNEMLHSHAGLPDCSSCHAKNVGVVWSGGTYNHSPTPTTCQDCHGPQRPVGLVGTNPAYDHANGGTGDCVSCHKTNIGVSWAGGAISHSPTPASCNACHNPRRPATTVYPDGAGTVQGHYGAQDCYDCHLPQSAVVAVFAFNHYNAVNTKVNTCQPCHQALGQSQHGATVKDCVSCHSSLTQWAMP